MHFDTVTKYLRRYPYQAITATLIMTITFFTITLFAILTVGSDLMIKFIESQPELTIFIKEETEIAEIEALRNQIQATGKASEINYVSKEEAFKIYSKQNESDPLLVDLVTPDILPASLDVKATKPEYMQDIVTVVQNNEQVDKIVYLKEVVEQLSSTTNTIRKVGVGFIGVLVFESLLVIMTIIGIKIAVRREEIEIMRLIGASNAFIRTPFLMEGMFYGIIGAILGWGTAFALVFYYTPELIKAFGSIAVFPLPTTIFLEILAVELILAVVLGFSASYIAVRRYLR